MTEERAGPRLLLLGNDKRPSILRSVPVSLPTIPVGSYPAIRQPGMLLKYPSGNTVIKA